jgi:uncharacterized protein (DUF885 family)
VTESGDAETLRELAHDYWEGVLRRNPILATFYGDYRYNDRLPNIGPDGRAEEEADLLQIRDRLRKVDGSQLDTEDRITRDMLSLALAAGLDALRYRLDEMVVDQMDGPQVWLQELLNWHPTDTPEHVQELIARYRAFDKFMDDYLDALRDGIRDGRTAQGIAVERVLGQLRATLAAPIDGSPLAMPLRDHPFFEAVVASVREAVYPAFERMRVFLERYAPRDEPGVWSVTDGAAIYALLTRQHTTTELSPDELHRIGLEDLERIHQEMRAIIRNRGDGDVSIRTFTAKLTRDPANLPASREELVSISEDLLVFAQAALPRAFGHLPHMAIEVKPIEEFREKDAPAAYYFQGSADGTRPAVFYVNTFEPSARPKHTLPALAFHEGLPGHHLQIALAQETEGLPAFRRLSAGWLANAFVEGWALYTERLADELGLYDDELARFGMLGYQAWRACRLVVDTGLHHLRWSRQQAIDFFFENVGLTERETVNEVDRYIVWPGQALAYKVGQREIERVRTEQRRRLGDGFDLRAFHDELLRHAAVPLSTLSVIFG